MFKKTLIEVELGFLKQREFVQANANRYADTILTSLEQVDDYLYDANWRVDDDEIVGAAAMLVCCVLTKPCFKLMAAGGDVFDLYVVGSRTPYIEFPFHRCMLRSQYDAVSRERFLTDMYFNMLVDIYDIDSEVIGLCPILDYARSGVVPSLWSQSIIDKLDRSIAGLGLRSTVCLIGFEADRLDRFESFIPKL